MKKAILICTLLLVFSGCNPYAQFYEDLTGGIDVLEYPNAIIPTDKPKLIKGLDPVKDKNRMLEEGYALLGYSNFNAAVANPTMAVQHGQKIHADTVIVYNQFTHTVSGSMPLTMPDTQTTDHSGQFYGSGGSIHYMGTSTTHGTKTTYMPFAENRFDFFATYWIKLKKFSLGIYFEDLTDELRKEIESNKGVYITVVVKDSPAFINDLLTGDIIRKVNGIEIIDKSHFGDIFKKNKDKEIELEILRNYRTITKKIKLD